MLEHRPGVTRAEHVAGVAGVTLAEHHLSGRERARNRELDHLGQIIVGERREQGDLAQQEGGVLAGRRHACRDITRPWRRDADAERTANG